jgi:hypothetical protein
LQTKQNIVHGGRRHINAAVQANGSATPPQSQLEA